MVNGFSCFLCWIVLIHHHQVVACVYECVLRVLECLFDGPPVGFGTLVFNLSWIIIWLREDICLVLANYHPFHLVGSFLTHNILPLGFNRLLLR